MAPMMSLSSILKTPSLRIALIFLPNFTWFFAGFVEFALRGGNIRGAISTLARALRPKIGDRWHADILIYLGAFGAALSASVIDAGYQSLVLDHASTLPLYLRLWGAAHFSQGIVGWTRIKPSGRWDWKYLGLITYVDTILCLWNFTLAFTASEDA